MSPFGQYLFDIMTVATSSKRDAILNESHKHIWLTHSNGVKECQVCNLHLVPKDLLHLYPGKMGIEIVEVNHDSRHSS